MICDRSQPCRTSRPAPALNHAIAIGVIVVGQLFACFDIAPGPDPDRAALDLAVAIRATCVIDEAGVVAADAGVAHPAAVDREAPDFATLEVLGFAFQTLLVIDQLAGVLN